MSRSLVQGVPYTITAALNKLDQRANAFHAPKHFSDTDAVGPFSVFRVDFESCNSQSTASSDSISYNESQERQSTTSFDGYADPFALDLDEIAVAQDSMSHHFDYLQWGDLFDWDLDNFGNPSLLSSTEPLQDNIQAPSSTTNWQQPSFPFNGLHASNQIHDQDSDDLAWPDLDLTSDAPSLLRHFNNEVISQMGALPINEKSAWRGLHYPSAVMTLSQLALIGVEKGQIRHANMANFYALIAVSAFHLDKNPTQFQSVTRAEKHWEQLSTRAYNVAKHHLNLSLEKELQPQTKAKYKEQLMGISATLAFAVSV